VAAGDDGGPGGAGRAGERITTDERAADDSQVHQGRIIAVTVR
jgi:hypothetical protein